MTKDLANHQFLSHDLSKHVAANLLDKDLRSQQRIEVTTRRSTRAKEKNVTTRDMMQRQRKSLKEGSCHDNVLYVATLKENDFCRDRKMMSRQGMIAS